MKKTKTVRGIEFRYTSEGDEVLYLVYKVRRDGKQKNVRERFGVCPPVGRNGAGRGARDRAIADARRALKERREEIKQARLRGEEWLTPKEQRDRDRQERIEKADERAELIFENAYNRFLKECGDEYQRPEEQRAMFANRLSLWFAGRYLDETRPQEIRQYYRDRLTGEGVFSDWPRKVGQRTPRQEIATLSALYVYLQEEDESRGLENPCHGAIRSSKRKKKGIFRKYRPERTAYACRRPDLREAIFSACDVLDENARSLISGAEFRAYLRTLYYTASRPEEIGALTHGAVALPPGIRSTDAPPACGLVTLGHEATKTSRDKRVPLHPDAAADLRAVMLSRPTTADAVDDWRRKPIFRKKRGKGRGEAWDRYTYRKAWALVLETATSRLRQSGTATEDELADLARMWVRDFRKTARTVLSDARPAISEQHIRVLMGHTGDVSEDYYVSNRETLEGAVLALKGTPTTSTATAPAALNGARGA